MDLGIERLTESVCCWGAGETLREASWASGLLLSSPHVMHLAHKASAVDLYLGRDEFQVHP